MKTSRAGSFGNTSYANLSTPSEGQITPIIFTKHKNSLNNETEDSNSHRLAQRAKRKQSSVTSFSAVDIVIEPESSSQIKINESATADLGTIATLRRRGKERSSVEKLNDSDGEERCPSEPPSLRRYPRYNRSKTRQLKLQMDNAESPQPLTMTRALSGSSLNTMQDNVKLLLSFKEGKRLSLPKIETTKQNKLALRRTSTTAPGSPASPSIASQPSSTNLQSLISKLGRSWKRIRKVSVEYEHSAVRNRARYSRQESNRSVNRASQQDSDGMLMITYCGGKENGTES